MKRRVLPIVAWLVATVASVLLATAAVGNVGSWGTDQPALQASVTSLVTSAPATSTTLAEPAPATSTAVPSTTADPNTSTTLVAAPDSTTSTSVPVSQPPTTTEAPGTSTTSTSTSTTTTTTTTTSPPAEEYFESVQLVGGWVNLRIEGDNVYFNGATAEPGFTIDLEHDGPEKVEIEFRSDSHDSKLTARVHDGELDIRTEEESEDDD